MRSADGIDPLNINLNELGQAILVQVENEVVDEVESVANNDQGELVSQFSLFEEVFDFLGVVEVAFPANTLDFANLARSGGGLDVLEVDFRVLAEIDDRPEVVIEPKISEYLVAIWMTLASSGGYSLAEFPADRPSTVQLSTG